MAPLFPGRKRPVNYFVDLFLGFEHEADRTTFRANSKYLVVTCALPVEGTTVMIYDLEAIKRGNRDNIPFIYKVCLLDVLRVFQRNVLFALHVFAIIFL